MVEYLKNEYLDRMKNYLNGDFDKYIHSFLEKEKHGVIINLEKLSKSDLSINEVIHYFNLKIIYNNDNIFYATYDKEELESKGIYIGKHPLHHAGLYYIQEPSAIKPMIEFPVEKNDVVLDMCASPGGKTIDALCKLCNEGFVVSNEIDYARSKILVSNVERMGFENIAVTCEEPRKLCQKFSGYFDKIIIDAPCSGEGMMRKNIEARKQWSYDLVNKMAHIQKELLNIAYGMLKYGGKILYSTCTFSKEEDEDNVKYIIDLYSDLSLVKTEKIYPQDDIGEGQFYAILKKEGKDDFKNQPQKKDFNELNLLKYGVEKTEKKHSIVIPTHAATHVDSISFENSVELTYDDIVKYIHGDVVNVSSDYKSGFCKVTYRKMGIGLGKIVNGTLKNHYPKGLRNI